MCPKLPPTAQPVPPLSREPHCTSRHLQTNHRNQNYFNKGSSQSLMNDEAPALTWSVKSVCDSRYFRKRNWFQFYVFSVFISYLRKNGKSQTLFLWVKLQGEDHRIVWWGVMVDTVSLTLLKGYLWTMGFPLTGNAADVANWLRSDHLEKATIQSHQVDCEGYAGRIRSRGYVESYSCMRTAQEMIKKWITELLSDCNQWPFTDYECCQ